MALKEPKNIRFLNQYWVHIYLGTFASLVLLTLPCFAEEDLVGFQTPTHNIHCLYQHSEEYIRCDVIQIDNKPRPRPKDCELDWGHGFEISKTSLKGSGVCASDTVSNLSNPVLKYGQKWQAGKITCQSTPSGLTCTNPNHHGFTLSRSSQKLF
jgi:hypothetical protein